MVNPNKGRALLPMPVIEAAHAGDAEVVERVLRYYEDYINKLCTRTLYEVTEKSVPAPWVVSDEPPQTIWLEAGEQQGTDL